MISSLSHMLPIYILGDSHVLAYRNLIFRETVTGSWLATRTKFISGLTTQRFFNPTTGEFDAGFIQALQNEGLIHDHKASHLSLREGDYAVAQASGLPIGYPMLMLSCGDIDVRFGLPSVLKDEFDFIPPFETGYGRSGKPLIPWDICEKILQDSLTPFIEGLKQLKACGFSRLFVPLVPPPTLDEERFLKLQGHRCPAPIRYKAVVAFNRILSEQCKLLNVPVLDVWPQVTTDGYLRPEFELDGVHLAPSAATMYLSLLVGQAVEVQYTNYSRYELYYRMARNAEPIFEVAEPPTECALSPNCLKPTTSTAPSRCTVISDPKVSESSAPWIPMAVEEFGQKGTCILKADPQNALRWKDSLHFDRDVGNRHAEWDWSGNPIKPFSKNLLTAQVPQKLLEELEGFFSQPDFDLFFRSILGCPVTVVNCRPIQSLVHEEGFSGPQYWHVDGCPPGMIRAILYLTDVDENTGPFEYQGPDKSVTSVLGKAGDLLIFDANRLVHRALPPKKHIRTALDFVLIPRLKNEKLKVISAGMNNWPIDPFSFSVPNEKSGFKPISYPLTIELENGLHSPNLVGSVGLRRDGWSRELTLLRMGPSKATDQLTLTWKATASGQPVGVEVQVADEDPVRCVLSPGDFYKEIPISRDHQITEITLRFDSAVPLGDADPYICSALLESAKIASKPAPVHEMPSKDTDLALVEPEPAPIPHPNGSEHGFLTSEADAGLVNVTTALVGKIEHLEKTVDSFKKWQKRSWFKRTFHRWKAPR